ncbi:flagellar biosynthetic protein FliQ [Quadrisphaera sp. GCM10027208]|jgi:flagellar biosynthetic protein FliQ|uniref:flagellar biosynthetic protein FliQ n=1 Tax=Quadrisphaera sp. GCM10027208 TaxID=3273423 RepID=UPI00361CD0FF|nr:flagellar biosynthetic protein FliQ [Kineosporiaceae bacterium SCSIO 59966]
MTDTAVIEIAMQAVIVAGKIAGPILLVTLALGLLVSLFQSVTQVQEFTLSFVPKVLGVAAVLLLGGNWMLHEMVNFTQGLFDAIPGLIDG